MTADTIFVFQKANIILCAFMLLVLRIDTELAIGNRASVAQNIIYRLLRQSKSGGLFSLRLFDKCDLLSLCRERLFAPVEPFIQKQHTVDGCCHMAPTNENLFLTAEIRAAPEVQQIVIRLISHALSVLYEQLRIGVVEEGLNKITAFSIIRMLGEERGDFLSVVFQGVAGSQKLLLFLVLVEVRDVGAGIEVVTA